MLIIAHKISIVKRIVSLFGYNLFYNSYYIVNIVNCPFANSLFNLFCAISYHLGLTSKPIYLLPVFLHATAVVPLPKKQSKTKSSGCVVCNKCRSTNCVGLIVGCSNLSLSVTFALSINHLCLSS